MNTDANTETHLHAQVSSLELTILMPCLNEAETLGICIDKAQTYLKENNVSGEILIADNGSTDGSQDLATSKGARVVNVTERGYGAALNAGIHAALGRYVIMADSDDSYDFSNLSPFVEKLREGFDLVMGNRFKGGIKPGAMPPLHRYLGNPVLTGIGRLFFKSASGDFHCGLRGFNRQAILSLGLMTTGMEFASEMVVKATLNKLSITEVPTTLSPDGRSRAPHLRSWRDGWRHLRFLLMFSPRWLFFYPGLFMFFIGLVCIAALLPGSLTLGGITFGFNSLILASTLLTVGTQVIIFALLSKQYAIQHGLLPADPKFDRLLSAMSLERALVIGVTIFVLGSIGALNVIFRWGHAGYGQLDIEIVRIMIVSSAAMVIGIQIAFSAFFSSILRLALKKDA